MIEYGQGVILTRVREKNIEILRRWRNDPKIYKWCRQVGLISELDQQRWYHRQNDDPTIQMFTIGDSMMDIVGVCGLTDVDPINRRAEFSLYIAPENQGKGYGRKALKTIISYGFNALNLNRIWGETFEGNPALDMFTDLGFETEGVRKEYYYRDGHYLDCTLVSIGRDDFNRDFSTKDDSE